MPVFIDRYAYVKHDEVANKKVGNFIACNMGGKRVSGDTEMGVLELFFINEGGAARNYALLGSKGCIILTKVHYCKELYPLIFLISSDIY